MRQQNAVSSLYYKRLKKKGNEKHLMIKLHVSVMFQREFKI